MSEQLIAELNKKIEQQEVKFSELLTNIQTKIEDVNKQVWKLLLLGQGKVDIKKCC